jgi:ribosome-associated protein
LEDRLKRIEQFLDDKKAENIEIINLTDKGYIVDAVVIATALNNKHSISLLSHLKDTLKPLGEEFLRVEEDGEWSVIDMGDILIHIMVEDYREKYNIEEFLEDFKNKSEEE